jgi:hypothetical protein
MVYSPRQNLLIRASLAIVAKVGPWPQGHEADGAAYIPAAANPAKAQGFVCHNCAYWKPTGGCSIVKGKIEPQGICRLHVISQERLVRKPESAPARRVRSRIDGETL